MLTSVAKIVDASGVFIALAAVALGLAGVMYVAKRKA